MNDLDEKAPVSKQEFFDFFQLVSATYSSDFSFNEYMVDPWNVDLWLLGTLQAQRPQTQQSQIWNHDYAKPHVAEEFKRGIKAHITPDMPAAGTRLSQYRPATAVSNVSCLGGPKVNVQRIEDVNVQIFRDTLLSRGARGIFGLRRNF